MTVAIVASFLLDLPTPLAGTDGHFRASPFSAIVSASCPKVSAEMKYREVRQSPTGIDYIALANNVELIELRVNGRKVPKNVKNDLDKKFDLFERIDKVEAWCEGSKLSFWILALHKSEWISYIKEKKSRKPETRITTLDIDPLGTVVIK